MLGEQLSDVNTEIVGQRRTKIGGKDEQLSKTGSEVRELHKGY
jgi:hypothetical protein